MGKAGFYDLEYREVLCINGGMKNDVLAATVAGEVGAGAILTTCVTPIVAGVVCAPVAGVALGAAGVVLFADGVRRAIVS